MIPSDCGIRSAPMVIYVTREYITPGCADAIVAPLSPPDLDVPAEIPEDPPARATGLRPRARAPCRADECIAVHPHRGGWLEAVGCRGEIRKWIRPPPEGAGEPEGGNRMGLKTVTITGADDYAHPEALADLSAEFPFVEWAILVGSRSGPRVPSRQWLKIFAAVARERHLQCSLHLCGQPLRDFLLGACPINTAERDEVLAAFRRVQLNTHGEPASWIGDRVAALARERFRGFQIICQIDGRHGEEILAALWEFDIDAVPFFDLSHGAGVLPGTWPEASFGRGDDACMHGYAGGLGPANLAEQIPRILSASGDAPVWIDMETRVRSEVQGVSVLDLEKVRRCLDISRPFVEES